MSAMALILATVAGSVVAGRLRGGRLRNLGHARLRHAWLVFVAVAIHVLLYLVARGAGVVLPLLALSHLTLLAFVWLNRMLPGMLLVFVGLVLNAAVILTNGAMPVDRDALLAVSGDSGALQVTPGKHRLLDGGHRLPWLADVIALPLLRQVVSVGDVVLAAGVGVLVGNLMRSTPPARRRRSPSVGTSVA